MNDVIDKGLDVVGDIIKSLRGHGRCKICKAKVGIKHEPECVMWPLMEWRDAADAGILETEDRLL